MSASPLDPETAQRVASLSFRVDKAVEGLLSGIHRSPHRGASVVFVEHREYRPGDEPRLIDWKAFARTDRHVIKRFEQETQLRATLLLDRSASMNWSGWTDRGRAKDEFAAELLAALAYLLIRQGDAVGVAGFDVELHPDSLPPRSRPAHLDEIFRRLVVPATEGAKTNLARSLEGAAERAGRRGVIALASDLLSDDEDPFGPMAHLVARGHRVIVFHTLHPDELDLPEVGPLRAIGLEGETPIEIDTASVRARYQAEIEAFVEDRRRRCTAAGARYVLARSDTPVARILASVLPKRGR